MEALKVEYMESIRSLMERIAELDQEIAAQACASYRDALRDRRMGLWSMVAELQQDLREMEHPAPRRTASM